MYDEELASRVHKILKNKGVKSEELFGGLAFTKNDEIVCSIVKNDLQIRVSQDKYKKMLKEPYFKEIGGNGHILGTLLCIEGKHLEDDKLLSKWVLQSLEFVNTLIAA